MYQINTETIIQQMIQQAQKPVIIPFVIGSIAFQLSKKADDRSYKWLCYLRGINNQNLSFLIKKVVFHLHPSCGDPTRQSTTYPFEINQIGWGQFQILLDVYLNLQNYPPLKLNHPLKLHHNNPGSQTKKPLCYEVYDEFVFPKMTPQLRSILSQRPGIPEAIIEEEENAQEYDNFDSSSFRSIVNYTRYWMKYDPLDHKNRLQDALKFVKSQISILVQKMKLADTEVQRIYEDTLR